MRPIRKGASPGSFSKYTEACDPLVLRLGLYCSYCERRILSGIAVEHIQPKGLSQYTHLENEWDNFLISCTNCNSSKGTKDVQLGEVLLPDRDNTFLAFEYTEDGEVSPAHHLPQQQRSMAARTLALCGLDKLRPSKLSPRDRVQQRMEAYLVASEAKKRISRNPDNDDLKASSVDIAAGSGFFSIWMKVFEDDVDMRSRLIAAFPGTMASGCFDTSTTAPITPAPNPDQLPCGGKV